MKQAAVLLSAICITVLFTGCSSAKYKKGEELAHRPIHCATAEGDIRALQSEKSHVSDQIASGISSIVPAGAAIGLLTGHEGENIKVGTGEYNKMIDKRIADIRRECGVK